MELPNLGAGHKQSHDIHVSIRNVTTELAKFAVREVKFTSKLYQLVDIG